MDAPLAGLELTVQDLAAQARFYEQVLGLERIDEELQACRLVGPGEAFEVALREVPGATPRPQPTIGLFHLALRLPDRAALAAAVQHLAAEEIRLEGAADHGVSEAVYLSDAEGNGIELYRDRPPEAWPTRGEDVAMITDPLDLEELTSEADRVAPPLQGTVLGHVHLCVPDLDDAETFFHDGLGLRVRQRDYPGARFLARGDYHHHVGVNTWARGRRAPDDAAGLASYTWRGDPDGARERFASIGFSVQPIEEGIAVEDPAGLELRVVQN